MTTFWRHLIRNDLRSRVMITLLVFSMTPLVIAAYQGYHCGRLAIIDLTKLHVTSVIEARHKMITEWLKERQSDIEGLARLPGLKILLESDDRKDSDSGSAERLLKYLGDENRQYESVTLYGMDWTKVAEINRREHEDGELLSAEFKEALAAAAGIHFDVAHEHVSGDIGIHFGCPVRNDEGSEIGYIVANLNLSESIAPLLQDRSGLWRTGLLYLVAEDLEIVSPPVSDTPLNLVRMRANPLLLHTIEGAGKDVRIYRGMDGEKVVGTAMRIPFENWAAVIEIDVAEAMHWLDVLLVRVAITLALSLAAILIVGLFLSRVIARPFVEIASVAHTISEGNLKPNVRRSGIREAEEVRSAFEGMVNELQRNEKLLIHSGRLAAIGELTSSVVHEMRNPLSSIKMNLQALGKEVDSDQQTGELVEIAANQTLRLEQMLVELLQYGKPPELNLVDTTYQSMVESGLEVCRESIEANAAQIESVDLLGSIPVRTDLELICRVISNLVQNAAEAVPPGGEIQIVGKPSENDDAEIVIEVHDNGPGLTPEQSARIFAPFYTTKPKGIGLGLAVVKNCAETLGGSIEVHRSPRGGAVFVVRLPNKPADTGGTVIAY